MIKVSERDDLEVIRECFKRAIGRKLISFRVYTDSRGIFTTGIDEKHDVLELEFEGGLKIILRTWSGSDSPFSGLQLDEEEVII